MHQRHPSASGAHSKRDLLLQLAQLKPSTVAAWILGVSICLGLLIHANAHVPEPWNRVSSILGWIYFSCWSVSDYPQVLLNYSRNSVVGLSIDYTVLSVLGCVCYMIFNCAFFFNASVRTQYMERDDGNKNAVEINDVISSVHDAVLSSIVLAQCWYYPRGTEQYWSTPARIWVYGVIIVAICFGSGVVITGNDPQSFLNTLNWLYMLSLVKVCSTMIMCVPQVLLNYTRKSTEGWNVYGVILDLSGSLLSILQLVIDSAATDDWTSITGDPGKFALGFVSVAFDLVFLLQHYVLYRHPTTTKQSETLPLIVEMS